MSSNTNTPAEMEQWSEQCECGRLMGGKIFDKEEECDEHPDRDAGYNDDGEWQCEDCRAGEDEDEDDDAEQCPRCKEYHCEEDDRHKTREFWKSNTDGVFVCRGCIAKEDEEEDEDDEDEDEDATCDVCHKSCKTDDTDYLVLIAEINGVKHCDECLQKLVKK